MNILVVDPEAEIRLLFFVAADELNCETFFATDGDEALDIWSGHDDIGLILLSAELPDTDACQLADRIRNTGRGHLAAIVFLSANEDTEQLVRLLRHGDDVVIKPFSQAVLLAKLLAMQRTRKLYLQLDEHNHELEQFRAQTEAEVQIAADVFSYINAQNLRDVPGVTTFLSAYSSLSGDLLLMAPRPGEGFNVLVADITGHGLPAALGTIPIAETFFSMTRDGFGVGDIAREMNKVFRQRMPDYLLCAAALFTVQDQGRRLQIWSGGMPAQFIIDSAGLVEWVLRSRHMALGALDDHEFDDSVVHIDLQPSQQLLCFTDGVTETTNGQEKLFGEDNLLRTVAAADDRGIIERIIDALDAFVEGGQLSDDVTIFCFNNGAYTGLPAANDEDETEVAIEGFHWRTQFRFDPPQLRTDHPLELILNTLPAHPLVRAARADISFIVNELFVNALDHGLLRLQSSLKEQEDGLIEYFYQREQNLSVLRHGHIELEIACEVAAGTGNFVIRCSDSGPGFNFATAMTAEPEEWRHSGRGLRTIAAMCEHLAANDTGNTITARYRWPRGGEIATIHY